MTEMVKKETRSCEDCGDDMEDGKRRVRCSNCNRLVCAHCYHHLHNKPVGVVTVVLIQHPAGSLQDFINNLFNDADVIDTEGVEKITNEKRLLPGGDK